MARLLLGSEYDESIVSRSAVVSAWGWSICLSSIGAKCPTQVDSNMFLVRRGVPSRNGERVKGFRRLQNLRAKSASLQEPGCQHHKHGTPPKHRVALHVGCETIDFYHANIPSNSQKKSGIRVSKTLDGPAYSWYQLDILFAAVAGVQKIPIRRRDRPETRLKLIDCF